MGNPSQFNSENPLEAGDVLAAISYDLLVRKLDGAFGVSRRRILWAVSFRAIQDDAFTNLGGFLRAGGIDDAVFAGCEYVCFGSGLCGAEQCSTVDERATVAI